jgi:hypothetical protein
MTKPGDRISSQTGTRAYMSVLDYQNARRLDQRQHEVLEERAHLDGPQLRGRHVLHGLGVDLQQPLDACHERVGRLLQGSIGLQNQRTQRSRETQEA